jgi:hypothetical protein
MIHTRIRTRLRLPEHDGHARLYSPCDLATVAAPPPRRALSLPPPDPASLTRQHVFPTAVAVLHRYTAQPLSP